MSVITQFSATAANSAINFSWDVSASLINTANIQKITITLNDFGSDPMQQYSLPLPPLVTDVNSGAITGIVKTFTIDTYNNKPLVNGTIYGAAVTILTLTNGVSKSYSKTLQQPNGTTFIKPLSVPLLPIIQVFASESSINVKITNYGVNGDATTGFEPLTKVRIYVSSAQLTSFAVYEVEEIVAEFGGNFDKVYTISGFTNDKEYEVSVETENKLGSSLMSETISVTPSDLPGAIGNTIALPTIAFDGSNNLSTIVLFDNATDQDSLATAGKAIIRYKVYRYNADVNDAAILGSKSEIKTIVTDASGLSVDKDGSANVIEYEYGPVTYYFKVVDTTVTAGSRYVYGVEGENSNGKGVITFTDVVRAGVRANAPSIMLTSIDGDIEVRATIPTITGGFIPKVSLDGSSNVFYHYKYVWSYLDASSVKQVVKTISDSSATVVSSGIALVNGTTYTVEAQIITIYDNVEYLGSTASATSTPYGKAPAPGSLTLTAVSGTGPLDGAIDASWSVVTTKNGSTGAITYSVLVMDSSSVMQVFASGITTTTYRLSGLTNGRLYTVTVRADVLNTEIQQSVVGVQTSQQTAKPFKLPNGVSNIRLSRPTDASLTFIFDACSNVTGLGVSAERYKINVYEIDASSVLLGISAEYLVQTAGFAKSQVHSGVNGKSYKFVVVSGVNDGSNTYYNATSQTIKGTMYGLPGDASNVQISSVNGGFRATWDAPLNLKGTILEGYRIISDDINTVVTVSKEVEYFIASGFTNGQTYPINIKTVASALFETNEILSAGTPNINFTPGTFAPATPINLTATGSDSKVTLSWSRSSGVTGWQVSLNNNPTYTRRVSQGSGNGWTIATNTISFAATGLTNGGIYNFKVSAFNTVNSIDYFSAVEAEKDAVPFAAPSAPQNLTCTVASKTINSSWSSPATTAGAGLGDNSQIRYKLVIDASFLDASSVPQYVNILTKINIASLNEPYTSNDLINGRTHFVRVFAYFTGSDETQYQSGESNIIQVIPNPPPQDVSGLSIVESNMRNVLSWINPTDTSGSLYPRVRTEVYFRIDTGSESKITDLSANTTSYTHTTLTNGAQYNYRVVSVHSALAQQPLGANISGIPFGKPILMSVTQNTAGNQSYTLILNRNGRDLLDYVFIGALPDGSGNVQIPVREGTFSSLPYSGFSGTIGATTYAANQTVEYTLNMGVRVDAVLAIIENAAGFTVKTIPTGSTTVFGNL